MRIKSKSKGEGEGEEGSAVPTLAFKRFRGDAGPDGRAVDEVSVARAVSHAALASTDMIVPDLPPVSSRAQLSAA